MFYWAEHCPLMLRRHIIVLMDFTTKTVAIDIHRNFRTKIFSASSKLDRARRISFYAQTPNDSSDELSWQSLCYRYRIGT